MLLDVSLRTLGALTLLVSSVTATCDAEDGLRPSWKPVWKQLPASLEQIGREVFGARVLCRMMGEMSAPQEVPVMGFRLHAGSNLTIQLVQRPGDASIKRLQNEFSPRGFHAPRTHTRNRLYGFTRAMPCTAGDVIVDVGANIGIFTIAASLLCPNATVISIEANPETYFFLLWNLWLNRGSDWFAQDLVIHDGADAQESASGNQHGMSSRSRYGAVVVVNGAISNRNGHLNFLSSPGHSQDAVLLSEEQSSTMPFMKGWTKRVVHTYNLPGLVKQTLAKNAKPIASGFFAGLFGGLFGRAHTIKFLKMDCESCEFEAVPADPSFYIDQVQHAGFELHGAVRGCISDAKAEAPFASYTAACNATVAILKQRRCPRLGAVVGKPPPQWLDGRAQVLRSQLVC